MVQVNPEGRPRIVHFSPLAVIGGCEVNCLRLVEALSAYQHTVVVFGEPGPMSERWAAGGARVTHLCAWDCGLRRLRASLTQWIGEHPAPAGVYYWSTSRLPTILNILTAWKAPTAVYLGNPIDSNRVYRLRLFAREFLDAIPSRTSLVACSEQVAASHKKSFYFRRFPSSVIYNAVTPLFDAPHDYRALGKGDAPRIGMVARLDQIKDHVTLIRALSEVSRTRPDVVVEFAGDGNLKTSLLAEVTRLKLEGRVRFLGLRDVQPLLAKWDIYVHSTTSREGMGTAVAEAMMAGLPCIVSDLPVMREVCGTFGAVYAKPGDPVELGGAILNLIQDPARRRVLGLAAQEEARRKFDLSSVARAYEGLMERGIPSPHQEGKPA
ncbi:MAG TPA: glycosyltransferase family 4 protein [Opitutaceae bacterium]